MAELKLKKPFELDGEMVEVINFDLDSLTGNDIEHAVTELSKKGIVLAFADSDQRYLAMIFSIASGMSYEDVNRLPARDYSNAVSEVRSFFLAD